MAVPSAHRAGRSSEARPYLVIPENQLAYAAITQLQSLHHARPSPIVTVFGPPGSGKSHLAQHLVRSVLAENPAAATCQVTASEFAAEWTEAVRNRTVTELHEMYGGLRFLVCEDLQALQGRLGAQEALVSLLDAFSTGTGRVLLTCSAAPGELPGLTPRLVNRCHGGICLRIDPPGKTSRLKLLQHFAKLQQVPVPVPTDVLEYMAQRLDAPPRELLGALTRLVQASQQPCRPIDLAFARSILKEEPRLSGRPVSEVAREVARQFGVTLRALRSQSRAVGDVVPRQAAMYLTREITHTPYAEIGRYFDGRTHSTVVHACDRFRFLLQSDAKLFALSESVKRALNRPQGRSGCRKPVDRSAGRRSRSA